MGFTCNLCGADTGQYENANLLCKECLPAIITDKYSRRKYFSARCKRETLQYQNYRCDECNGKFTRHNQVQYHHIDEDRSNNDCDNCSALHAGCHDMITKESRKRGNNGNDGYDDDDYEDKTDDAGAAWAKKVQSDMENLSRIG